MSMIISKKSFKNIHFMGNKNTNHSLLPHITIQFLSTDPSNRTLGLQYKFASFKASFKAFSSQMMARISRIQGRRRALRIRKEFCHSIYLIIYLFII